jgi:hypothetical protein
MRDEIKKDSVTSLINSKNYLLTLQGILRELDPADYHTLLNDNFNNPAFEPSELHKIIFDLDARIVVTTNFDKIYENYCHKQSSDGYKTLCYDSTSLVDEIRSDTRLIIKAHGSINDINKMVFTKSQYHQAKRNHPNFYEILKALFITNTVLLIGCGLNDPDVCLLLEEIKIIGSSAKPYYLLIKQGEHNPIAMEDWRESYNILSLEYGPSQNDLITDLNTLLDQVTAYRIDRNL